MNDKFYWVEYLKVFGIFAVILGHIANPYGAFIYSWHMPLFFIIAGFFLKFELSMTEFVIKNFKRLMIPYFIFAPIGLITTYIKNIILNREQIDLLEGVFGIFIWMDIESLIMSYAFVLWFLPTLFFARLFLFFINKCRVNTFIQGLIVVFLFFVSFYIELPFGIDNAFNASLFVFIGTLLIKRIGQTSFMPWIGLSVLILLFIFYGIEPIDMAYKKFDNIPINIIWAITFIYMMIFVFQKIEISFSFIHVWASQTMFIFIIHPYTNNMAHIAISKLQLNNYNWVVELVLSIFIIQIILIIKIKYQTRGILKYV